MSVASKLRFVVGLYVALLAAVLLLQVRTSRRAVESAHAVSAIATRVRVTSNVQMARIEEMATAVAKYRVTRDSGYLEKLSTAAREYGGELRRFDSLSLGADERTRARQLAIRWRSLGLETGQSFAPTPLARESEAAAKLERSLDEIQDATKKLGEAAQAAMSRELARAEADARGAERLSWMIAVGALILGVLLSLLLIRSIVRPLGSLRDGTRAISAGRFEHRLDTGSGDEIAQVAGDFNAMAERLGEIDAMKREFVSNVSHDLKTPLTSMQESTEVLLDGLPGPLTDRQKQLLQFTRESGGRLSSMISKLLQIARMESTPAPAVEIVDLAALVCATVDRVNASPVAVGSRARVTFDDFELRAFVPGDPEGLAQLLDNLLENAVKFSPADRVVRVTIAPARDSVALQIADQGPGISDADKERVFDRFYQTRAGRAVRGRGVGLGLSICRHVVSAHRGRIWITDNPGGGSIFNVSIPGLLRLSGAEESPPQSPLAEVSS